MLNGKKADISEKKRSAKRCDRRIFQESEFFSFNELTLLYHQNHL